jgi:hypothetical protein
MGRSISQVYGNLRAVVLGKERVKPRELPRSLHLLLLLRRRLLLLPLTAMNLQSDSSSTSEPVLRKVCRQ